MLVYGSNPQRTPQKNFNPTTKMNYSETTKITLILSVASLFFLPLTVVGAAEHLEDPERCDTQSVDQELAQTFGSVGVLANLRGTPGSIRAVARQLLSEALEAAPSDVTCPAGCDQTPVTIVYKVMPTTHLDDTKQRNICRNLESKTTKVPFRFAEKRFASLNNLNEWMMDFSRGKGPDGKRLYRMCASNCSPRYTFLIKNPDDGAFQLESEVVCGRARDRSVKRYSLSISLRMKCTAQPH